MLMWKAAAVILTEPSRGDFASNSRKYTGNITLVVTHSYAGFICWTWIRWYLNACPALTLNIKLTKQSANKKSKIMKLVSLRIVLPSRDHLTNDFRCIRRKDRWWTGLNPKWPRHYSLYIQVFPCQQPWLLPKYKFRNQTSKSRLDVQCHRHIPFTKWTKQSKSFFSVSFTRV